jgi:hypothetical protein
MTITMNNLANLAVERAGLIRSHRKQIDGGGILTSQLNARIAEEAV